MTSELTSYIPILSKWPTMEAFGEDIGITGAHARTLKMRDSLPSQYWERTAQAAVNRGFDGVDMVTLARIAAAKKLTDVNGKEKVKQKAVVKQTSRNRQVRKASNGMKVL